MRSEEEAMAHQLDIGQEPLGWQVESLRATTFHVRGAYTLDPADWWELVIQDKPEQVLTLPKQGLVQQSGVFEGRQLVLTARLDRVDWNLQGVVDSPRQPTHRFPTLGPLSEPIDSFSKVAAKWFETGPEVTRLAFGAVLLKRVADLASAYQELSRFLPSIELDGIDTPDFLYQINRPRTSKSPTAMRINRLNKWSVLQEGTISIGLGPGTVPTLASTLPNLACRLELDINTSAESLLPISRPDTQVLFKELVDLGREIADQGDIP